MSHPRHCLTLVHLPKSMRWPKDSQEVGKGERPCIEYLAVALKFDMADRDHVHSLMSSVCCEFKEKLISMRNYRPDVVEYGKLYLNLVQEDYHTVR